jgi:DNA polymerase III subunit delta'
VPRFAAVLGQDRVIARLRAAIERDRVHHAYLFTGAPGSGKRATALAFASALDCLVAPGEGCETCDACVRIAEGNHPDVVTLEREGAARIIPIESVRRNVVARVALPPHEARTRVFIVDEATALQGAAANALLKTLEEPPARTMFVLATAAPEQLLPTIRSRCQRVTFSALGDDEMGRWIDRESAREGSALAGLGPSERADLLLVAEGAPGMASLAAKTGMGAWVGAIGPMLEDLDAGRPIPDLGRTMAALINDWAAAWVESHQGASKEAANKAGAGHMLRLLASHYRRALLAGSHEGASRAIETIADMERTTQSNVQAQFTFEDLAAKLSLLRG